ncbi:lipopolysaccharide biosynthesis protein [Arthrobacter sp. 754]|uniref:lipopolysaccharide biosynthesis protein n=1 Tax=Arthrobacter sp. 754 TaxID=3156315 RepID=UPI00339B1841
MRFGKPRPLTEARTPADLLAPSTLANLGARGAMWQGFAQVVGKGIVLLTTIVLARLLSPEEYGLIALALVVMAYAETLADAGVAQALVYLPRSAEIARSALLISILMGGVLAAGALVGAPLISEFFGREEVTSLVQVLAVSLLATALAAVPESLLRRELRFQRLTAATVIRAVVTGALSMSLAFAGYGAWSLPIGTAAGSIMYAVSCWVLLPEHVSWRIWHVDSQSFRANLTYGFPVAGSNLLARLIFDIDYLIIGRMLGAQALGFYILAFRLPELLIINVFFVLSSVMFPLYARVRNEPVRLQNGYLKSVQMQALYGVTAGVGLAVVAPALVPVLFGDQWDAAVLPLVFLALYASARSLGAGANDVYKAIGRPSLSIWISIVRLAVLIPVLLFATQWGIAGVAAAQFGVTLLFAAGMQTVAAKVIGVRGGQLMRAVLPGLVCGAIVTLVGLGVRTLPLGNELLTVSAVVAACVAAVFAALRLGFPSLYRELLALAFRR